MIVRILIIFLTVLTTVWSEEVPIDRQVSDVVAQASSASQQRRILELLPSSFGKKAEWNALLDGLNLELLGESDCQILTRTALLLEQAYARYPQFVRPPQRGDRMDPHGLITRRIKILVLPDIAAFDKATYADDRPLGTIDSFWSSLFAWAEQHQLRSKALEDVQSEVAALRAGKGSFPDSRSASESTPVVSANHPSSIAQAADSASARRPGRTWLIGLMALVVAVGALYLARQRVKR